MKQMTYEYIEVRSREPKNQCRVSYQKDTKIWNSVGQVLQCAQTTGTKHCNGERETFPP